MYWEREKTTPKCTKVQKVLFLKTLWAIVCSSSITEIGFIVNLLLRLGINGAHDKSELLKRAEVSTKLNAQMVLDLKKYYIRKQCLYKHARHRSCLYH